MKLNRSPDGFQVRILINPLGVHNGYDFASPLALPDAPSELLTVHPWEQRRVVLGVRPILQGHVGFQLTDEGHRRRLPRKGKFRGLGTSEGKRETKTSSVNKSLPEGTGKTADFS